jgi:hypothetical protein
LPNNYQGLYIFITLSAYKYNFYRVNKEFLKTYSKRLLSSNPRNQKTEWQKGSITLNGNYVPPLTKKGNLRLVRIAGYYR